MDSSPSLLDVKDLAAKFSYKRSTTENHASTTDSKMKALIGEVSVRWEQQQKKATIPSRSNDSDEDMFECGDENDQREVETGTKNAKKSTETVGKKSTTAADDVYEGPASSPELKTDDDYEPSSAADSSDSEEWLSKDKLKSGKKRSRDETYRSTFDNVKRRRVERDMSDDEIGDENDKMMKYKSSFEMLKNIRQMRLQKKFGGANKTTDADGVLASTTSSVVSCETKTLVDDVNESSAGQSSDASLSRTVSKASSEAIDETDGKKSPMDNNRTEFNRKRFVSESEDEKSSEKSNDVDEKFESPKLKRKSKRVVLLSSDDDEEKSQDANDDDEEESNDSERSTIEKPTQKQSAKAPKKLNSRGYENKALKFFQESTLEELSLVPRFSERVAESLIALRPFDSYENLLDSIRNAKVKGLKTTLVEGYVETLELRNDLDRLLYSCTSISDNLKISVNGLLNGHGRTVGQPELIQKNLELKPYQIVGLNWLVLMNKQKLNCILADEMGLGKTIQVISFFAYLKERGIVGPHLIVVPSSTLDNWLNELRRWCPSLTVLTYYGSMEDRKFLRNEVSEGRQNDFDILLSTYHIITSNSDDKAFLKRLNINYSVFDEAHMLKSAHTARYRSLMKVKSQRRLLLTGTPLQNNLMELISLMHFVMPTLFYDHTENLRDILNLFQIKSRSMDDYEREKINQAKNIMRPFVLRRLKTEVLDQLPKKHERIEFCELDGRQLELYGSLVAECAEAVKKNDTGGFSNNDARCFLMQLRKAANHPLLLRRLYDDEKLKKMANCLCKEKSHRDADPKLVVEDMQVMSDFELSKMCNNYKSLSRFKLAKKYIATSAKFQVLDRLLPESKSENNKVLLFSQFTVVLDIMEEYLHQRKYKFLRLDGSTPVVERQQLIDKFNSQPDLFVFLLSTRAGGLGINLTSANVIVLHDIDYNPYNDRQAEDRCHRVGQMKEVTVIRLIAKNTIDESMLACAKRKLQLEKEVTAADIVGDEDDPKDIEGLLKLALNM